MNSVDLRERRNSGRKSQFKIEIQGYCTKLFRNSCESQTEDTKSGNKYTENNPEKAWRTKIAVDNRKTTANCDKSSGFQTNLAQTPSDFVVNRLIVRYEPTSDVSS